MTSARGLIIVALVLSAATSGHRTLEAQEAAEADAIDTMRSPARAYQLQALRNQRRLLLAMLDSMPEKLFRDRASPTQRDFAQQIHHAANAIAKLVARHPKAPPLALPDTTTRLGSRDGLREFVNAAFDYMEGVFNAQTEQDRHARLVVGKVNSTWWVIWDTINAHTMWTAGQIVANFRKHGMPPPDWLPI